MPSGLLTTVPPPVPSFVTESVNGANVKVTPRLTSGEVGVVTKRQLALPPLATSGAGHPDRLVIADVAPGVAVRVTWRPAGRTWSQSPEVTPPA